MHLTVDFARSAAAFVVVLGVLVFFHELGHYLAARWRGVHIEAFSIGFGRAIAGWTDRHGTRWKLGWLPLGGYVKLHGQERPEDVSEAVRAGWQKDRTFHGKSVGSRAIVVAAGPVANFVLAIVLFAALFATVGRPVAEPVVGQIVPGSAAALAGLHTGDRIERVGNTPTATFAGVRRAVQGLPGRATTIGVQRAGAELTLPITLGETTVDGAHLGLLGVTAAQARTVRLSPGAAVLAGVGESWSVTRQTVSGLWQMISGRRGTAELGGPLRIAQLSGQVAQLGLVSLVSFIAVLSINLGLINLFPIPILDGGHLLFYALEALRGRPLPARAQEYGYRAGLALIGCLFVFATFNDLTHLGLFHWVAGIVG